MTRVWAGDLLSPSPLALDPRGAGPSGEEADTSPNCIPNSNPDPNRQQGRNRLQLTSRKGSLQQGGQRRAVGIGVTGAQGYHRG